MFNVDTCNTTMHEVNLALHTSNSIGFKAIFTFSDTFLIFIYGPIIVKISLYT